MITDSLVQLNLIWNISRVKIAWAHFIPGFKTWRRRGCLSRCDEWKRKSDHQRQFPSFLFIHLRSEVRRSPPSTHLPLGARGWQLGTLWCPVLNNDGTADRFRFCEVWVISFFYWDSRTRASDSTCPPCAADTRLCSLLVSQRLACSSQLPAPKSHYAVTPVLFPRKSAGEFHPGSFPSLLSVWCCQRQGPWKSLFFTKGS